MKNGMMKIGLLLVIALWTIGESRAQAPGFAWARKAQINALLGYKVAIDATGNSYVTGHLGGTAPMNTSFGSIPLSNATGDLFLTKYDPAGNELWAFSFGSPPGPATQNRTTSIAVDATGNVYVTGAFSGTASFGPHTFTAQGQLDFFLVKYDPSGNVIWAIKDGGSAYEGSNSLAIDAAGNCYITGTMAPSNQAPSGTGLIGTVSFPLSSYGDAFVAKYGPAGNFLWADRINGDGSQIGVDVTVDDSGNIFACGHFYAEAIAGSLLLPGTLGIVPYLVKYDAAGNVLWGRRGKGYGTCYPNTVLADSSGNCYITGEYESPIVFENDTLYSSGSWDVYIAKYDATGNLLWTRKGGGIGLDYCPDSDIDKKGNVYLTGLFGSIPNTTTSITFDTITLMSAGLADAYTVKYDPNGSLVWAVQAGGASSDQAQGIALDQAGNAYISGVFRNASSFGSLSLSGTGTHMFLAKLGNAPLSTLSTLSASSFSLSPNPARSQVWLTHLSQPTRCTLYNLLGQPIRTQPLSVNSTEATLPLHGLASGLYTLQVQSAGGVRSEKLVIE